MSEQDAEKAIEALRDRLTVGGFAIGAPKGAIAPAGSGGFAQAFAGANIYWHSNTGAHEVHGNILARYLELGGPGPNPLTGRRDFGYPTADEASGFLGERISRFEFGAIYTISGHGAVGVYGELGASFAPESHGLPLVEPFRVPEGELLLAEEACLFRPGDGADAGLIVGRLIMPQLGRPALVTGVAAGDLPVEIDFIAAAEPWQRLLNDAGGDADRAAMTLMALWAGRLFLRMVRNRDITVGLRVSPGTVVQDGSQMRMRARCHLPNTGSLRDRTLYDLAVRLPDGGFYTLAPHALYSRRDWRSFGFIHATDLHVSRRVETFRARLRAAGRTTSVRLMTNPNDSLRSLIRYANALHERGEIDLILATGDLVDYVFETGDDRTGGGNFAFLRLLLLGGAPSSDPEGAASEELKVPFFTVLGNHDYVQNPYRLFFKLHFPGKDKRVEKWDAFNLELTDAEILDGAGTPFVSMETAKRMGISSRKVNTYYLHRLNSERDYVVRLGGRHRIVMLDTGPNRDTIDDTADAIGEFFGFSNEDEDTFVRGTPTSTAGDLSPLQRANDDPLPGVFVVAMHGPPINPSGNEYPHFLRETERPALDEGRLRERVLGYLSRQGLLFPSDLRGWLAGATAHFKEGSVSDLIDFGIPKWNTRDSTEVIKDLVRGGVDLVLCGHIHERAEFRVRLDKEDKLHFFNDFYTENPAEYRETSDWSRVFPGPAGKTVEGDTRPILLEIDAEAQVGRDIEEIRDQTESKLLPAGAVTVFRRLRVPPYPDPLEKAKDKSDWWDRHRPLVLLTACLGPADYPRRPKFDEAAKTASRPRVTFQGVRVLSVENDHITSIAYVGAEEIRTGPPPPIGPPPPFKPPSPAAPIGGVVAKPGVGGSISPTPKLR